MIKILRKHRNWLMIVIAVLALPFCLYFVKSDTSLIRSDAFAQIYGHKLPSSRRTGTRVFMNCAISSGYRSHQDSAPGPGRRTTEKGSFVVNLAVLRHEAERLGIETVRLGNCRRG